MQEGCGEFLSIPTVGVHILCLGSKCLPCVDLLPGGSGELSPSCGGCSDIHCPEIREEQSGRCSPMS